MTSSGSEYPGFTELGPEASWLDGVAILSRTGPLPEDCCTVSGRKKVP